MSLAERLAQAPKGRGHSCSIGILLSQWPTDTEERRALITAMESKTWPATEIARVVSEELHHDVNARHIQAHRRGDCTSANCPWPATGRLLARQNQADPS